MTREFFPLARRQRLSRCLAGACAETPFLSDGWRRLVVWPSRRTLDGCGPDRDRHTAPGVTPRCALRQVQDDAMDRLIHPDRQLQQPLPQGGDLGRSPGGALGPPSQLLEQHRGC